MTSDTAVDPRDRFVLEPEHGVWQLVTKMKIPKVQLLKVGAEGYIHGFICVRPPCGHGTTKAWRDPKNGKVYHGGHLEGKTYVGGTQIGGIRKNANGTFSGQHNGALIGSGKMKLKTEYDTHQGAVDSVAEYHNLHLLAQHTAKHDGSDPAAHLHAAANALAAGDTHKVHDELTQAEQTASGGPSRDSIHEQLQAHDQLHGVGTTHQDIGGGGPWVAKKTLPSAPPKPVKGVPAVQHPAPTPIEEDESSPEYWAAHPNLRSPAVRAAMEADDEDPGDESYKDIGHVHPDDITLEQGDTGDYEYIHAPTGTKLGFMGMDGNGESTVIHSDGTDVGFAPDDEANAEALADYHNENYDQAPPGESLTPVTKPAAPTAAWAKAGGEISTQDLTVKKNGDVVHKPTGTVVGTLVKQADTPHKGTSTFTASHADGTQTHVGVYKGNALASIALHHNSVMKGETPQAAQPEAPEVSMALPFTPTPTTGLPAKVAPHAMTLVPHSPDDGVMDYIDGGTGMKIGETVPASGEHSFNKVKHVNGAILSVMDTTSTGAPLPGSSSEHAKLALAEYHNSLSVGVPAEKKPYEKLGAINAKDVNALGGQFVHTPSNTLIGTYTHNSGGFDTTHIDHTPVYSTGNQSPKEAIVAYHNKKYAGIVEMTAPPEASSQEDYEELGTINPTDVQPNGAGDFIHDPTGTVVGHYKPQGGEFIGTHEDGTVVPTVPGQSIKSDVVAYHNSKYGGASTTAPEPPPAWLKAGTSVKAADVSVKQDGTSAAIDKVSKQKIGTVTKKWNGWVYHHEDGTTVSNTIDTKKEAVAKLVNYHNQTTAIHQAVKINQGGELAKMPKDTTYGYSTKMNPQGEVTHHTDPWNSDKDVSTHLGTVKSNPDGTATVTHTPTGATWTVSSNWEGKNSLAFGHQQAVKRAQGDVVSPKPKTQVNLTPVPPAPVKVMTSKHTTLGNETLKASELAAVKKYTGSWYGTINKKIATSKILGDESTGDTSGDRLTSALNKSELSHDIVLNRGISNGNGMLGEVGSKIGKVGIQHSFMSSSQHEHTALGFGGYGTSGLLLTIHAPKGAKAMDVKSVSYYSHETEILFQHGTMYHVNSDVVGADKVRRADITIIGLSSSTGNHTMYQKMGASGESTTT